MVETEKHNVYSTTSTTFNLPPALIVSVDTYYPETQLVKDVKCIKDVEALV